MAMEQRQRRRPLTRQEQLALQERKQRRREKMEESRELARGPIDVTFCLLVLLLTAIGLVMLLSASFPSAYYEEKPSHHDPLYYFERQAVFAVLGTAVMFLVSKFNYQRLRGAGKALIYVSVILLILVIIPHNPIAVTVKGATRWLRIGGIQIQAICLVIPVITIISLVVLLHIVNHTKTGMAMRAVSKDYEIARVMGVDIDKIISITFIIGSSLAAIGAIMWGIRYPGITPMMGVMPGLKCFIAAVIGGIGNIKGAVLGGFILGLGEILIVAFFPQLSGYRDAFAFIVLIVILFYKPTGLLGEKTTEKV